METLKFLVCDDSKLIRMKLSEILKKLESGKIKVEVYEASDGQIAIENYKSLKPDIVFLDITMPIKNGLQVLEEIMEFDKNARVIMASSAGTKEHLKKAIDLGVQDFIQKPLEEEKVLSIIKRIMRI